MLPYPEHPVHLFDCTIGITIVLAPILFLRSPIQLAVTVRAETGCPKVLSPCPFNVGGFERLYRAAQPEYYTRRRRFN
jgi:hypothetical protein